MLLLSFIFNLLNIANLDGIMCIINRGKMWVEFIHSSYKKNLGEMKPQI